MNRPESFNKAVKCCRLLLSCLLGLSGCRYFDIVTPIPPLKVDVTAGHKYSAEALEFLDLPGTTRQDVIATLGRPLVESAESRVSLYTWETTRTFVPFKIVSIDRDPRIGARTTTSLSTQPVEPTTNLQRFGLFIAYDDDDVVGAHEVRRIGASGLEEACAAWWRNLINRQSN